MGNVRFPDPADGSFTEKVVLITGGTEGIGRRAAERFAAVGMRVVIAARREDLGIQVADAITMAGGNAMFVRADVSVAKDVERLLAVIGRTYGQLDYAFNNAGINRSGAVVDVAEADFDALFDVNTKGLWLCMREELRLMQAQNHGAIVNNLSVHSFRTVFPGVAAYAASKSAGVVLTRAAAIESLPDGIRVNAVAPGPVATAMLDASQDSVGGADAWKALIPAGRVGKVDEVVDAVLWLLSDSASFVVGQVLPIDGGFLAQ